MLLSAIALVAALAVWIQMRRLKRRIDTLSHWYWELRYEYTQLRSAVDRLDSKRAPAPPPASQPEPGAAFVPLSSLRK
ncbi:MAG TPA: hypothetical protein VHJ77_06340 [Vicinamibacterales bacterium]|jgi:hypothetical protein|nr:hypothetical protein [Vicinamibacterales bacterium]